MGAFQPNGQSVAAFFSRHPTVSPALASCSAWLADEDPPSWPVSGPAFSGAPHVAGSRHRPAAVSGNRSSRSSRSCRSSLGSPHSEAPFGGVPHQAPLARDRMFLRRVRCPDSDWSRRALCLRGAGLLSGLGFSNSRYSGPESLSSRLQSLRSSQPSRQQSGPLSSTLEGL